MDKFKFYVRKAFKTFNQMEMRVLPGNIAFFFVLAIIPIITIVVLIASEFSISMDSIIRVICEFFPDEISTTLVDVISGKGFDTSVGLFNFVAFFVASNGTYAIINASNTLYQVSNNDILKDRIKSILLLFILIFLIAFLILISILSSKFMSYVVDKSTFGSVSTIFNIFKWPITSFLLYINLKLIYTIAPSKRIESSSTTYGAIFTTVIWIIATVIFSSDLKYFANYNVVYGNLSSIIILMMWLYIISYVFVLGIAINVTNMNK